MCLRLWLKLCHPTPQFLRQAPGRLEGGGRGLPGRTPIVEAVPGVYPRGRRLRRALCRRNSSPILDRWRLKTELFRQLFQLRQVPLAPAPGDQIAFLPPLGILGGVRTRTHGRSLPISAAASGTGTRRVRTAGARGPFPAAAGASVLAEFSCRVLWPFTGHHLNLPQIKRVRQKIRGLRKFESRPARATEGSRRPGTLEPNAVLTCESKDRKQR